MKKADVFIEAAPNVKIHMVKWLPALPAKGVVQLIHGFGESAGCYDEWAARFAERGIAVIGADLRGHGKTTGKRGVVDDYDCWLDDAEAVRRSIRREFPGLPLVLYGHSMGGNISLNLLLRRDASEYVCAVITSPWLRLHRAISPPVLKLTGTIARVLPRYTVLTAIRPELLTHDPGALKSGGESCMRHGQIGAKTLLEMLDAGRYATENVGLLHTPTLLMQGTGDTIVSVAATEELAAGGNEHITYVRLPGQYHELHHETERDATFETVLNYVAPHIGLHMVIGQN